MTDPGSRKIKRTVLAYSGGLDTSIIIPWLRQNYGCEVIAMVGDVGQGDDYEAVREKALKTGAAKVFVEDLRQEFITDYLWKALQAGAVYEGKYLLGTSLARPVLAKRQVEVALECGADAVAHGCTGKGNDQVRFELTYAALAPELDVIAPWREWDFKSREALLDFAEKHQIQIAKDKRGEAPFSVDANLLHTSSEGRVLENPADEAPDYVLQRITRPEDAPDAPEMVEITFEKGDAVAINGKAMSPATILTKLNELGGKHGVGILDLASGHIHPISIYLPLPWAPAWAPSSQRLAVSSQYERPGTITVTANGKRLHHFASLRGDRLAWTKAGLYILRGPQDTAVYRSSDGVRPPRFFFRIVPRQLILTFVPLK